MKKSKNLAKKLTALALSATLCTPAQSSKATLWPFGGNHRILDAKDLIKEYSDEEMAQFTKYEQEQIFEFKREMAEKRVHQLLSEVERLRKNNANDNADEIARLEREIAANGAVVMTSKASGRTSESSSKFFANCCYNFYVKILR